jgi:hypothetical protein
MAATATVRTFWGALLSVLLQCLAALGFRTAATRTPAAAHPAPAPTGTEAGATAAVPAARAAGSPGSTPSAPGQEARPVPAPRVYEPLRTGRDRLLPPTMKQRISAEAHGATPAGRSLPAGTLVTDDGYGGLMTVPAPDDREPARGRTARHARSAATGGNAATGRNTGEGTGTSRGTGHAGSAETAPTAGTRRFAALHG